jgi:hypothetical protein
MRLLAAFAVSGLLLLAAADKKPPVAETGNQRLGITATLYHDKEAVKEAVGSDLGGYFIVVRVELAPKDGQALNVLRDDFLLRSHSDGQKSGPFAPSQIAGRGALVVGRAVYGGGVAPNDPTGPVWGGIPGTGGMPQQLPQQGSGVGNMAGEEGATVTAKSGVKDKENPVLAVLKQKVLPEKEIREPLAGLLYFSLEGKHKPKDLELQYNGPAGKLTLQFH